MARMRTPRDLDNYVPAARAAALLESVAKDFRLDPRSSLVKVELKISYWNPPWVGNGQKRKRQSGDGQGVTPE